VNQLELHGLYRLRRRGDGAEKKGGQRVTGLWLRIQMKRLVRKHCGDHAADCFKASRHWLQNFARRFGISWRRKSNTKAEPVEVRLPKIRRWHARLRRRLKRRGKQSGTTLHPKWGRWLPRNRLAIDQVPILMEPYSFTDADGGPDGAESEVEEDEEEHGDTLDGEGKEGDEAEEDEEVLTGTDYGERVSAQYSPLGPGLGPAVS